MAFLVISNFGAFTQYLSESEVSSGGPSRKYMSENLIMELIFFFYCTVAVLFSQILDHNGMRDNSRCTHNNQPLNHTIGVQFDSINNIPISSHLVMESINRNLTREIEN